MSDIEVAGRTISWPELMNEALTMPGGMGNTYNRFYDYSFGNQVLLYFQGVKEPVATYKRWLDMGRQVLKGSKAKAILRPITLTREDAEGEEHAFTRFKMVKCLFGASETEGEPMPDFVPKAWSRERALGELAINEVAFTQLNGNIAGYSFERNFALNPVAPYPFKTTIHELGHILLGHTAKDQQAEYQTHRGVKEFQAESTAYLTVNELEATDQADMAESRAYIQTWLRGTTPDDKAIKQVFATTTQILKAGREAA